MSQLIEWRFAGTQTIYQTTKEKFDATVTKLRNSMNIHVDHEIIIENEHTTTQPDVQSVEHSPVSDSDQHVDQPATVSKPGKAVTFVDETPELSDLPGDLDFTDAESDLL